jgi:hypothetical protein
MGEPARVVLDLAEVQRVAREVVATTPAPELAERLVERLRAMHAPDPVEVPTPSPETRAAIRAKLRRLGA